jgi:hypothetical protein
MRVYSLIGLSLVLASAACGPGGEPECTAATSGANAKYVTNSLKAPANQRDLAYDLIGAGKTFNQLGAIMSILASQGLDPATALNEAVTSGDVLMGLDLSADDLANSNCAACKVNALNKPAMPPRFDGSDVLTINTGMGGGTILGKLTNSQFRGNNPAKTSNPVTLEMSIVLVPGGAPTKLVLNGAYVQFTRSGDNVMSGQINGAIKNSDVMGNIIPSVAQLLTDQIAGDPNGSTEMQIKKLFDTGGCGTAMADDNVIASCELAESSIIKSVLRPDVQMFDASGAYKPNAANETPDSLSVGLGFTATKASIN